MRPTSLPGDAPAGPAAPGTIPQSWRWCAGIIALYGLTFHLVDLGPGWALTFHETIYAEPAREFLEGGDWLVPRILGRPKYDKPPGTSWTIAASMAVFGTDSAWAARLPTVVETVLLALVVAGLAARWHGPRIGLLAGLIQLTPFYVLFQARLAETDMLVTVVVAAAMGLFAIAVLDPPGDGARTARWAGRWWASWAFFAVAGASYLIKGPVGPAFILSGAGLFALVDRRKATWRFLIDPIGWACFLAPPLAWSAAVVARDPSALEVWKVHLLDRATGKLGGQQGPLFYLYMLPLLALPWTPFAAAALLRARRERGAAAALPVDFWRLLGCWLVAGTLFVSVSAWKHKHYLIPALPPLSIWAACGLDRYAFAPIRGRLGPQRLALALLAAAGLAALAVGGRTGEVPLLVGGPLLVIVAAALLVATSLRLEGRPAPALVVSFAAFWLAFVAAESFLMPAFDLYGDQARFAQRVNQAIPAGATVTTVEIPDPQATFYLRHPIADHVDRQALLDHLLARGIGGPLYIVAPRKVLPDLERMGTLRLVETATQEPPSHKPLDRLVAVELRASPARLAALAGAGIQADETRLR